MAALTPALSPWERGVDSRLRENGGGGMTIFAKVSVGWVVGIARIEPGGSCCGGRT